MTLDPRSFLATVAGYTAAQTATDSANRPVRLATVDPDYTGTGPPKVTFDGESTKSAKLYAFINSYRPAAGDRVVLVPAGTTYVIAGKISDGTSTPVRSTNIQSFTEPCTDSVTLGTTYADVTGCTKTVTVVHGTAVAMVWAACWFQASVSSTGAGDAMVGSLNVDGSVVVDDSSNEISAILRPVTNTVVSATVGQSWRVPLTAGSHTIKLVAKRSGTAGQFDARSPHTTLNGIVFDV